MSVSGITIFYSQFIHSYKRCIIMCIKNVHPTCLYVDVNACLAYFSKVANVYLAYISEVVMSVFVMFLRLLMYISYMFPKLVISALFFCFQCLSFYVSELSMFASLMFHLTFCISFETLHCEKVEQNLDMSDSSPLINIPFL